MRKPKATPPVIRVGSLNEDDFTGLAGKVVQTLADGPRFIWVADDACVYSGELESLREMPKSWMVGTFAFGQPAVDIADDLRALALERSKNWILD